MIKLYRTKYRLQVYYLHKDGHCQGHRSSGQLEVINTGRASIVIDHHDILDTDNNHLNHDIDSLGIAKHAQA